VQSRSSVRSSTGALIGALTAARSTLAIGSSPATTSARAISGKRPRMPSLDWPSHYPRTRQAMGKTSGAKV
jgi:hypothetical protein